MLKCSYLLVDDMLKIYNFANEDSNNIFQYKDSIIKATIDIFIKIFIKISSGIYWVVVLKLI